jgi:hypothetical protein
MKQQPSTNAIRKRRQTKIAKLGQCGPFVAGSLNRVQRKQSNGKVTIYYLLTFKEQGRTRSVYVPKDMVKEVRQWVRNYQKLKKGMEQISTDSIVVIQRFVQDKQAENAKRPKR